MMKATFAIAIMAGTLGLMACGTARQATLDAAIVGEHNTVGEHSPTNFIVTYDSVVGKAPLLRAIEQYDVSIIYDYHLIHGMALRKSDTMTLEETMARFRQVEGVLTVEYDHIIRLTDPVKPKIVDR